MLALQLEVNLPLLLCFTLHLRAIFQVQAPGGLYLEGRAEGFCVTGLGGLYLAIFGGLYLKGLLISEFYGILSFLFSLLFIIIRQYLFCNSINIIGDELLLNFGAIFQR